MVGDTELEENPWDNKGSVKDICYSQVHNKIIHGYPIKVKGFDEAKMAEMGRRTVVMRICNKRI